MSTTSLLIKELRKKHIVTEKSEDLEKEMVSTTIQIKEPSDMYVRDSLLGYGKILKEDLDQHYYVIEIKTGFMGNAKGYGIIQRVNNDAEIVVYAHEGLIKQNLAEKTLHRLEDLLRS